MSRFFEVDEMQDVRTVQPSRAGPLVIISSITQGIVTMIMIRRYKQLRDFSTDLIKEC